MIPTLITTLAILGTTAAASALFPRAGRRITLFGMPLALLSLILLQSYAGPLLRVDELTFVFAGIVILISWLAALSARDRPGAYWTSLALTTLGMVLASAADDLVMLYLAIELVTIPSFMLVMLARTRPRMEAVTKYLVVSLMASALLLLAVLALTISAGTSSIPGLLQAQGPLLAVGVAAFLAGLGFKLGAWPFNLWIPDVYQASSPEIAGLLAGASKKAAFVALIRVAAVLGIAFAPFHSIIAILAALSITIPNLIAMRQEDPSRMLAYSIMTHAGYLLMGLAATGIVAGTIAHAITHAVMALGAFLVIGALGKHRIDDLKGMGARNPFLAATLTILLLSLAGIPPFAGFVSKLYLFSLTAGAGMIWLTVLAVLNSAIALYYYFRIIRALYDGGAGSKVRVGRGAMIAIIVCLILTIAMGVYPIPLLEMAAWAGGMP